MKICFLVVECSLDSILNGCGGVGTFYASLARQLSKRGHQVEVLVFPVYDLVYNPVILSNKIYRRPSELLTDCDEYIFDEGSVKIRYIFHSSYHHKYLEFSNEYYLFIRNYMARYSKKSCPDIVEVSEGGGYVKYVDIDCPVVMRLHTGYSVLSRYNCYDEHWIAPLRDSENFAFSVVDSISGVSQYVIDITKQICKLSDNNINGVIYNAIEFQKFSYADYSIAIPNSLVYIGGLYKGKGVEDLLRLFNEIYRLNNTVTLLLIGKGSLDDFADFLSSDAKHNVTHLTHIKHCEVANKLKQSSIFITASKHEACPLAPMEAMAVGRTVFVYSNCKSFTEIVEDNFNGVIWGDLEDVTGAAMAIIDLLNSIPKMELIGNNSRSTIESRFGINRLVTDTESWYNNVLDNHSEIRLRNNYRQINYMRNIVVENLSYNNWNNNILIHVDQSAYFQIKNFIKQILNLRGVNKKNLLSLYTLRKFLAYIKI